jgi:hypothetical protein
MEYLYDEVQFSLIFDGISFIPSVKAKFFQRILIAQQVGKYE